MIDWALQISIIRLKQKWDITTMSQTNPLQLYRVHNEGMRVTVGTTKDTPIETTRFMLDLPPMQIKQKVEHVK